MNETQKETKMNEHYVNAEYTEAVDDAFIAIDKGTATSNQILIYLNEIAAGWVRESI